MFKELRKTVSLKFYTQLLFKNKGKMKICQNTNTKRVYCQQSLSFNKDLKLKDQIQQEEKRIEMKEKCI